MSQTYPSGGTPLKRVLREDGRRQNWLAEKIGVDQATMSRYVNGLHVPDDKRRAIAAALGRDLADVFPQSEVAA
jgi:transcriptional regulator with XRE-family HTH domain